jgi:superfamily II DNA/RNA helicase
MDSIFPWLNKLYQKLLIEDLQNQLPGIPIQSSENEAGLSLDDRRKLILAASALSLSTDTKDRKLAYEISTRLLETGGQDDRAIAAASDIIFSRLGNFPGRRLLREMHPGVTSAPTRLSLERLAREFENTVDLGNGREANLTDFQFNLFQALGESRSFSVSAPTSAGKSFVLGLDLVRRLHRKQESVVYLVPTRALIREVANNIRGQLRDANLDVPVRTVPLPLAKEQCPAGLVYVLTQERLMSLLATHNEGVWISTLFVDEAHNVQDDVRGVVLQAAIERVSKRFPTAEINFASPLSANPQMLLSIARKPTESATLIDRQPPVSQNLILVREKKGKPAEATFSLLNGDQETDLGTRKLPFRLRGDVSSQKASIARSITGDDEATIVFANGASSAEDVAREICTASTQLSTTSRPIEELIEFIKSDVHPKYPLIDCLPHGVAFHYGDMPPLVRARVEDLFKSGEIRIICCTSTLLQGINLPARHIIIEDPRRGTSGPMPRRDFLNLAGRAGRLLKEFHGNIWCVRPDSWEDQVYKGPELTTICSALDLAMKDGGTIVQQALDQTALKPKIRELGEAVLGQLFLEKSQRGEDFNLDHWKTDENSQSITETERTLNEIRVSLPLSVLEDNAGIRPDRLQKLYDLFSKQSKDGLKNFLPLNPWTQGYYERMEKTIKLVEVIFRDADNNSYKYYAWLAGKWIHGTPLGEIISNQVGDEQDPKKVSNIIRSTLKTLESEIRFRLVKHYLAFCSILKIALEDKGLGKVADSIEPFHVYLECGASSNSLLNMIALGLSRSTAISVDRTTKIGGASMTPEETMRELMKLNLEALPIPGLCKRELRELTGH